MALARFGYELFYVNSNKGCYTMDEFGLEFGKDLQKQGTTGHKPITYIVQKNLVKVTFKIHLDAHFVDIDKKIAAWQEMAENTKLYAFSVDDKMLSKNKFLVQNVKVSNVLINGKGKKLKADLDITIEEYAGTDDKVGLIRQRMADYS